ncbi:hypothetical protein DL767_004865 [Monosporascus sp. MG133]|nr:hypothetical protein DL767_004865 [Monosporascus sp. MG133]
MDTSASCHNRDVESTFRGAVDADLTFIALPTDGSAPFITEGPQEDHNETETHTVRVEDIRGQEQLYSLDKDAFLAVQDVASKSTYETFDSEDDIRRVYYPEVEALLLKNIEGARRVKILGHGVRRESAQNHRQPILFVHCDHTEEVAARFAREYADSEKAPELLGGRWRIINVWRPLNGTVLTTPMAFASANSLNADDLFSVEMRYPDHKDWFSGIRYNSTQRWFYWSGMGNSERLILKCSDNALDIGKQAFHSAFLDRRAPAGAKQRESIEVRTLVFS